jgi:branched-subunit amino acid ABC-type transport system permease component
MDWGILWRATLCQAIVVAVLGATTGLTLPHSFFETWGWLIGPAAWLIATYVTVRVVRLPMVPIFAGAIVAGLISLLGVFTGQHWTGSAIAIVLFALWCGWQGRRPRLRLSVAPST